MSDAELLIEEIKALPENYAGEVLRFIKHLKMENTKRDETLPPAYSVADALKVSAQKISAPGQKPISHYFGQLKNSKAFAGDPVEIQRKMRAEWN